MQRSLMWIACLLALFALVGCTMQVNTQPQIPQITSSGEGEVSTEPDQATVYVRVESQNKVARDAQTYNKDLSNKIKDTFLANGLKEKDIETSEYSVTPERNYYAPTKEGEKETYKIVAYTVRHVFKLTIKDLEKMGEIVDDAVQAGANGVDNVMFGLSKEKEIQVKGDALKIASRKAKEKAQAMADSLGVRLGKVISASESGGYVPYYSRGFEANKMMLGADMESTPSPITPGKVDVQTQVNLVYEISQ